MILLRQIKYFFLCTFLLFKYGVAISQVYQDEKGLDFPKNTIITKLADETYVNGLKLDVIGISVPLSIKDTSLFFLAKWSQEGWKTSIERNGDFIFVNASNYKVQKVASLTKRGDQKTDGSISVSDLPYRLSVGKKPDLEVGKHLPKPLNTVVMNEVLTRDKMGESIMTTLMNGYSQEQNSGFYRERMVELGWREQKNKVLPDGKGTILVFEKSGQEATFTFFVQKGQNFITVNWLKK